MQRNTSIQTRATRAALSKDNSLTAAGDKPDENFNTSNACCGGLTDRRKGLTNEDELSKCENAADKPISLNMSHLETSGT